MVASLEPGGGSVRSLMRMFAAIATKAGRGKEERAFWESGDKNGRDSRKTLTSPINSR